MWLMPSSTALRSTASASSWSRGGPRTPGPGNCMAPYPTRPTWKEPNGKVCIISAYTISAGLIPGRSRLLGRVRLAEDVVDLVARIVDDVGDALLLLLCRGEVRLGDRTHQLGNRGVQVELAG